MARRIVAEHGILNSAAIKLARNRRKPGVMSCSPRAPGDGIIYGISIVRKAHHTAYAT